MIALALLLLLTANPGNREASIIPPRTLAITHTVVTTTSVEVPDVIAPAVIPYFRCIAARNAIAFNQKGVALPPPVAKGADCSGARQTAIEKAEALMKATGSLDTPEARYASIAATLQSIESLVSPRADAGK